MAQDLSSRRALIVDDEFLIAFDLEASMHELGFDVCNVASNEKDAKELAMSNPPDVVVMDVYLGGARTGIETARPPCRASFLVTTFVEGRNEPS